MSRGEAASRVWRQVYHTGQGQDERAHTRPATVLATSFVTSHTSTAFTFSIRSIILFSASQRHPAWDIRSETRRLHLSDFPFLSLPSGKRHRTAREWRTDLPVFRVYVGRCLANQANTRRVCLVRKASTECGESKNTGQFRPHHATLSNSSKNENTF